MLDSRRKPLISKNWAFLIPLVVLLAATALAGDGSLNPDESTGWQGYTGLFNVISPDTLDKSEMSFGLGYRNYDRETTDLDSNEWSLNFAIGVTDRLELGLNYVAVRQNDVEYLPVGAYPNAFPFAKTTIDEGSGDVNVGAKFALKRIEETGMGVSLYGGAKLHTASTDKGLGSGGPDFTLGGALGWQGSHALYGNVAYSFIGDGSADGLADVDLSDVLRASAGFELGSHRFLRGIAEISSESYVNEPTPGSTLPQEAALDLTVGFKLGGAQHGGFGFGAAYQHNLAMESTINGSNSNPQGALVELSYTTYEAPMAEPAPDPHPPVNHNPTAKVTVNPAEVYPAHSMKTHTSTATCRGADPDGDRLTYSWSASGGQISGSGPSVTWTPDEGVEKGVFTVTCRVKDGKGGSGQGSADIRVKPDPVDPWFLHDRRVYFDFDRYDLRDESKELLGQLAGHMSSNPSLRLVIEGHTCFIATEEYNLALGQHRANSIQEYLVSLGVEEGRMNTTSLGESRPWQDNAREITRRLNRRGEFGLSFEPQM